MANAVPKTPNASTPSSRARRIDTAKPISRLAASPLACQMILCSSLAAGGEEREGMRISCLAQKRSRSGRRPPVYDPGERLRVVVALWIRESCPPSDDEIHATAHAARASTRRPRRGVDRGHGASSVLLG